jgi:hypothetical protein
LLAVVEVAHILQAQVHLAVQVVVVQVHKQIYMLLMVLFQLAAVAVAVVT